MGGKLKISTSAVEPIPIYNYGSNHNSDIQRIKPGETTRAIVGKRLRNKATKINIARGTTDPWVHIGAISFFRFFLRYF